MIAITTTSWIEGYQTVANKGIVQGAKFDDLLKNTEALGANAVVNTSYDNALDVDTFFHGPAVLIEHTPAFPSYQAGEGPVFAADSLTGPTPEAK